MCACMRACSRRGWRAVCGVQMDEFTNPKKGKTSQMYRITYRSMERSLTNEEINEMQMRLRERATDLGVELR